MPCICKASRRFLLKTRLEKVIPSEESMLVGFLLQLRLALSESALNLATDIAHSSSITATSGFTQNFPKVLHHYYLSWLYFMTLTWCYECTCNLLSLSFVVFSGKRTNSMLSKAIIKKQSYLINLYCPVYAIRTYTYVVTIKLLLHKSLNTLQYCGIV